MTNDSSRLTKICNVCGIEKSLSAFLITGGPIGTSYSNTCSSCRLGKKDASYHPEESDEDTESSTGLKIDSKTKVQTEIDKRAEREQTEKTHTQTREKEEKAKSERLQKKKIFEEEEKKHLEKKSFLQNYHKKRRVIDVRKPGTERSADTEIRFDVPFEDTQFGEKLKYQGFHLEFKERERAAPINQFRNWLGKKSPVVKAAEKASPQLTGDKNTKIDKEAITDFVKKNFKGRP